MNVSVVIPVFNEKESLPDLVRELEHTLGAYPGWEVIFVDDGSSDGSTDWIVNQCESSPYFKLIQFYRNYGKAAALAEGFKIAAGEYIITMDADLQDDPAEIPNFISKLEEGWDLVSGWKKTRLDPLNKRLPSKIFNLVTRLMTGVKIHDFNCGLKGYKKAVVKSIDVYGGRHRYIPALAGQQKFKVTEIVVNHRARQFGETKYDRMISYIDTWIGKILQVVDLSNTILIISSDHGDYIPVIQEFGEISFIKKIMKEKFMKLADRK